MAALSEKEAANEALKLAAKERAERAAALEDAFLAIKQATGVATVEEMVEKFLNQGTCSDCSDCSSCSAAWCSCLRRLLSCLHMSRPLSDVLFICFFLSLEHHFECVLHLFPLNYN